NGLKLNKDDITFHEDVWAGGGNFGACMEYFSGGIELGNQVYMKYEQTQSGYKELNQKVLDMGMGQERCAWFTQPEKTSYDTTFPKVVDHIFTQTGIKRKTDIMKKFKPYASYLNDDETQNLDKEWEKISKKIDIDKDVLKSTVSKTSALYSIADHSRSLLVAINDGALPSNVGGGYNLRIILRRALDFINEYDYDIDFNKLMELHADYLKPQYPELSENLDSVQEIIKEEVSKYKKTKKKTKKKIKKLTKTKDKFTYKELKKLYQSDGISPEDIKKVNKEVSIEEGFYSKLSENQTSQEQIHENQNNFIKEFKDFEKLPKTKRLYYDDFTHLNFDAKLIKTYNHNNKTYIVLDKTYFYPTSGGQQSDKGIIYINNKEIKIDSVIKFEDVVFHITDQKIKEENKKIKAKIDKKRRYQLTKHHTGAHIINYAAHKYLGSHVWQAGAHKTIEKGRLDITHYKSLSLSDELEIERNANELIKKDIEVEKFFEDKDIAEKKYGMRLYQGGAIPGSKLRIIKIDNYDVEACGGTHLNRTSEAESIRVINSTRIQDGVVRIEYVAGTKAKEYDELNVKIYNNLNEIYNKELNPYNSLEELNYLIKKSKKLLNISRSKLIDKLTEFNNEIKKTKQKLIKQSSEYNIEINLPELKPKLNLYQFVEKTFNLWKKYKTLQENFEEKILKKINIKYGKINLSSNSLRKLANKYYPDNFLIYNKDGFFVINDNKLEEKLKQNNVGFGGRDFKQGKASIDLLFKLI
ncbi:MAG: alanine--tRNA ligase-related protein, partial [Candidatus Woesearchaeota archaeon]